MGLVVGVGKLGWVVWSVVGFGNGSWLVLGSVLVWGLLIWIGGRDGILGGGMWCELCCGKVGIKGGRVMWLEDDLKFCGCVLLWWGVGLRGVYDDCEGVCLCCLYEGGGGGGVVWYEVCDGYGVVWFGGYMGEVGIEGGWVKFWGGGWEGYWLLGFLLRNWRCFFWEFGCLGNCEG